MNMTIMVGLIVLVAVILFWLIVSYNGFVKLKNSVEEAYATMDVYLKKRYDLIPNLVKTVKGYAAHEQDVLQNVTDARNLTRTASTPEEKLACENALSGTLRTLFALSENYPDLKASSNFMDLQRQLQKIEEDIANARKFYNAIVKMMNTRVQVFPSNLIAKLFHFTKQPMFEVNSEVERENVSVEF